MTDKQRFTFDKPAQDLPFGWEVERRRREEEESVKDRQSVVAIIRNEIKRIEEKARQRRDK